MKWFKHQTDASDDIKIKRLEDKFGVSGYAAFFKIIEKIGKEGHNYALDTKKYPTEFLAKDFGIEKKVFDECLTFMNELGLITTKKDFIFCANMKKYADEYTEKKGRKSGQGRDFVGVDKNRLDKNKSNLSFKGQKARIYFGTYQVWSGGSWKNLDPKYIKEVVEA